MTEPLRLHEARHPHGADPRDPADVVPAQVHQHGVLGSLLRVGSEIPLQLLVLRSGGAARPRAGDGPHCHLSRVHLDEKLRRGAEQLAAAEPQVEVIRRGRGRAQGPVEREPVAIRQLESLREHRLEDVARADVLQRAAHGRLERGLAAADRPRLRQPPQRRPTGTTVADAVSLNGCSTRNAAHQPGPQ